MKVKSTKEKNFQSTFIMVCRCKFLETISPLVKVMRNELVTNNAKRNLLFLTYAAPKSNNKVRILIMLIMVARQYLYFKSFKVQ